MQAVRWGVPLASSHGCNAWVITLATRAAADMPYQHRLMELELCPEGKDFLWVGRQPGSRHNRRVLCCSCSMLLLLCGDKIVDSSMHKRGRN